MSNVNILDVHNLIPKKQSECATYLNLDNDISDSDVCSSQQLIERVARVTNLDANLADTRAIIDGAKKITECDTERCVLTKLRPQLGNKVVNHELDTRFKVEGPRGSDWLGDNNIDATLKQWHIKFPDFFPYNFNMRNYASYSLDKDTMRVINEPDTLASINFEDLFEKGFRTAACICNTDTYQGKGKHWIALFVDARDNSPEWTAEIFDSAGVTPYPEWQSWLSKTKIQLNELLDGGGGGNKKKEGFSVRASRMRHQDSNSECGVYSLFYVWARLNGISYRAFQENKVPDKLMFEFRQHLFHSNGWKDEDNFDWDEYQRKVKIEWGNKAAINN